jgi:hypothetical protein
MQLFGYRLRHWISVYDGGGWTHTKNHYTFKGAWQTYRKQVSRYGRDRVIWRRKWQYVGSVD